MTLSASALRGKFSPQLKEIIFKTKVNFDLETRNSEDLDKSQFSIKLTRIRHFRPPKIVKNLMNFNENDRAISANSIKSIKKFDQAKYLYFIEIL